ncbi:MAG: tetratricopeptide repeat protein, partial [Armatimonadetes bacterium]|nr:tetratricopeptide repeat protein [Armatimonadota bacterium]NIO97638.1 tetratricopeptide repeat protein [Armatimonadota bacterium]
TAHRNKGLALCKLGRQDEALACFDRAIQIKPDSAEARCRKGAALGALRRYEEALICYDSAIKIWPDHA